MVVNLHMSFCVLSFFPRCWKIILALQGWPGACCLKSYVRHNGMKWGGEGMTA